VTSAADIVEKGKLELIEAKTYKLKSRKVIKALSLSQILETPADSVFSFLTFLFTQKATFLSKEK
jgi:predicted alpha/beta-hydrolase family hydrolase